MLLISCYSPSGENYNKVEVPDPPVVNYVLENLNELQGDTLIVYGEKRFNFTVDGDINSFRYGQILVDSIEVTTFNNPQISFEISLPEYSTGTYELDISTYYRTNSGTLLEQVGTELFVLNRKWVIDFRNEPCIAAEFNSPTWTDSTMMISWTKNDPLNHSYYVLTRRQPGTSRTDYLMSSSDSDQNFYEINDILGGIYEYHIRTRCNNPFQKESESVWHAIDAGGINLEIDAISNGKARVTWNKVPISTDFRSYSISSNYSGYSKYHGLIDNPNDTTFFVSQVIGENVDIWITAQTNTFKTIESNIISISHDDRYATFPFSAEFYKDKSSGIQFMLTDSDIRIIDEATGIQKAIYQSIQNPKVTNTQFVGLDISTQDSDQSIIRINKNSFEIEDRLSKNSVFGSNRLLVNVEPSFGSEFMLVTTTDIDGGNVQLHYINFESESIIETYSIDNESINLAISPNGNYFIFDYDFYTHYFDEEFSVRSISSVELRNQTGKVFFSNFENDFYYQASEGARYIFFSKFKSGQRWWDLSTNVAPRYNFDFENTYFDKNSAVLVTSVDNRVSLSDLNNDFNEFFIANTYNVKYIYTNNHIHASNGYKLEVEIGKD